MIDVLFCCDRRYRQHFGVAATSLLVSNPEKNFRVHLITDSIDSSFRRKIETMESMFSTKVSIYTFNPEKVQDLPVSNHISHAAYYVLFAPIILPNEIEKILYLDSDLIVRGDIGELYDLDLGNTFLAARGGRSVTFGKRLQLESGLYFNSGVMLLNLNAFRTQGITEKCISYARENPKTIVYLDQDALNKVVDGKYVDLEVKWNFLLDLSREQLTINDEVIIHYVGSLKPWQFWCFSRYKNMYWNNLHKSPWRGAIPHFPANSKQFLSALKALAVYFGVGFLLSGLKR